MTLTTTTRERVAIVTGAASGIGEAAALSLAQAGYRVVAADVRDQNLEVPDGVPPDSWISVVGDVSREAGAQALTRAAIGRFGRVDVLVHCAGAYETGDLAEVDEAVWDHQLAVNVRSAYLCSRAAIAAMAANGFGRIVLFSSIAAQTGGGVSAGPAYVASKSAVLGLTRSLALKVGPMGITVNAICPGVIDTPMIDVMGAETKANVRGRTPMGRLGTPADVVTAVMLLASDESGFITGTHLDVNGGLHMD